MAAMLGGGFTLPRHGTASGGGPGLPTHTALSGLGGGITLPGQGVQNSGGQGLPVHTTQSSSGTSPTPLTIVPIISARELINTSAPGIPAATLDVVLENAYGIDALVRKVELVPGVKVVLNTNVEDKIFYPQFYSPAAAAIAGLATLLPPNSAMETPVAAAARWDVDWQRYVQRNQVVLQNNRYHVAMWQLVDVILSMLRAGIVWTTKDAVFPLFNALS